MLRTIRQALPGRILQHVVPAMLLARSLRAADVALPRLSVSDNHRFLMTAEGRPFFWLGDTAWELFHRLTREEALHYLDQRARNGFTVIQAVALAELDGLNDPNAYGHRPLKNNDPTQPDLREGERNDYWDQVDFIVREANRRGLYIGFLPTWGDKWNKKWGTGPEVFTPQNAEVYGEWLGKRYREAGIVWILGGDRPVETEVHREILRALSRGLRRGDEGRHLQTFHPTGGAGSAELFHDEPWLDFNMRQNGHTAEFTGRYEKTREDYERRPSKPVLDGEPLYEDHPVSFDAKKLGHSIAGDVRRPLYWDLFSGAFGHTYGHHSIWQMFREGKQPVNNPLLPWTAALEQPGALQMQHARALLESRPFFTRVPADDLMVASRIRTHIPGAGRYYLAATRDSEGSYAMVYVPIGRAFAVRMSAIRGDQVKAWWFNPRDGEAKSIGTFPNRGEREFAPSSPGEMLDWVLVLDDASKGYRRPGRR